MSFGIGTKQQDTIDTASNMSTLMLDNLLNTHRRWQTAIFCVNWNEYKLMVWNHLFCGGKIAQFRLDQSIKGQNLFSCHEWSKPVLPNVIVSHRYVGKCCSLWFHLCRLASDFSNDVKWTDEYRSISIQTRIYHSNSNRCHGILITEISFHIQILIRPSFFIYSTWTSSTSWHLR